MRAPRLRSALAPLLLLAACAQGPGEVRAPRILELRRAGDAVYFRWQCDSAANIGHLEYELRPLVPAGESAQDPPGGERGVLPAASGSHLSKPLAPGRYTLALRAIRGDGKDDGPDLEATPPEHPIEIHPSGYRFVARAELGLERPMDLRVIYTLHPFWCEGGRYHIEAQTELGDSDRFRRLLAAVCRDVLAEAFRDARDLQISDSKARPWERIEEVRRVIGEFGQGEGGAQDGVEIPGIVDPDALLIVDYRTSASTESHTAQLAVRLYDMSASAVGLPDGEALPRSALGRALIFEDYVELGSCDDEADLSLGLVAGWKEILLEMANSARVAAFRETLRTKGTRIGRALDSSWLLGVIEPGAFGEPESDLQGYHRKIEERVLFPAGDGFGSASKRLLGAPAPSSPPAQAPGRPEKR